MDDDNGKVTLALIGAKLDTLLERIERLCETMEDHDQRIRSLEQSSVRQEERLSLFAGGLAFLQLVSSSIAAWIGRGG